jgi:hypothetical protein
MPHTRSIMMHAHRALWGTEPADKRHGGTLTRLDATEQAMFCALRDNVHGQHIGWSRSASGLGG